MLSQLMMVVKAFVVETLFYSFPLQESLGNCFSWTANSRRFPLEYTKFAIHDFPSYI